MKLESLNSSKFASLTKEQKLQVRGGTKTAGNKVAINAEYKQEDGRAWQRIQWRSWGADDIGEGYEFYYNTDEFWGNWEAY